MSYTDPEDPLFSECYDTVRGWVVQERDVGPATILGFVSRVMALLQAMVALRHSGARKKRLCLSIVRKVVMTEVQFARDGDRAAVEALLLPGGLVDGGIDVFVSVARGALGKVVAVSSGAGCCMVA